MNSNARKRDEIVFLSAFSSDEAVAEGQIAEDARSR
jgi:hypothetical protein